MIREIQQDIAVEPSRITVAEYLQDWLTNIAAPHVRPTTFQSYESLVKVHIVPHLGGILLQKLTAPQVQTFYTTLRTQGRADGRGTALSPRTVQYCHTVFKMAIDKAVAQGLVARNVVSQATPPRSLRPQIEVWDAQQVGRFLDVAASDGYGAIWLVALATGMRRGELLALQWQDVDLEPVMLQVGVVLWLLAGDTYSRSQDSSE
jgi:integrase